MSLLHATWLPAKSTSQTTYTPALFVWGDTWRVATPSVIRNDPEIHPFALSIADLKKLLRSKGLLLKEIRDVSVSLTLPSKPQKAKAQKNTTSKPNIKQGLWSGLPLQAEEAIPKNSEWWPWTVKGIAIPINQISPWLTKLPLSQKDNELGQELLWWSHLQRWSLSLIARGLWLPQVSSDEGKIQYHRAHWTPLLNQETERRRLEEFSNQLPLVATCATTAYNILPSNEIDRCSNHPLASCRPIHSRLQVAQLLEKLIDSQLRKNFQPKQKGLDPLIKSWEEALGPNKQYIHLSNEDAERLAKVTKNWKDNISGNLQSAKACLELIAPIQGEDLWGLEFSLQSEADPSLRATAAAIWNANTAVLQLGAIEIQQPGEVLLEGLGRALNIFAPIERGLEQCTPEKMQLTPAEALILIRTSSKQLRDIGIGVILPKSLSGGFASRLGIAIKADLFDTSSTVEENLEWSWELMIGGILLSLKELQRLIKKNSPLVYHKGSWIELRPNDLKRAEKFYESNPQLNLDDALRLTATHGNTFMKLPVHNFDAGPRLQKVLEQYHQQTSPKPMAAPDGFYGQLRPYQERGLGWLTFLHRFKQGACLADDMGLGKTIQVLAFIQSLKKNKSLTKTILLIAPTSVLTNWKREAFTFTPELNVLEHYGPQRSSTQAELKKSLQSVDIMLTSYGLLLRDKELVQTIDWQGVIIDEAQTIKNPNSKQSQATRDLVRDKANAPFRIALTGTPVENRVSEIWSLMNFLNPLVLGEEEFFHQRYKLPIESYGDTSSLKDLKARVTPFILRRLKSDKSIISDLPEKVELNEWIGLSNEQKELYNKTVEKTLLDIETSPIGERQGKTLGLLTRLKQICNHPALIFKETVVDKNFGARSAKVQRLEEILKEILEAGDRALLFTQFVEWGFLLQSYLEKKLSCEIPFLHGTTKKTERQLLVDRFQEDPRGPKLFLLSLKAGGIGINLTRANHVFHIDRWWNPAIENQATDRAYRIGQTNRVMVHKFITTGSIEEKINKMLLKKSQLAEDIIGSGEEWLGQMEINQLRELVSLDKNL